MQKLSSQVGMQSFGHERAGLALGAKVTIFAVSSLLALVACGGSQPEPLTPAEVPPPAEPPAPVAEAITTPESPAAQGTTLGGAFQPKSGSKLSGTAKLTETPEGVKVTLAVEGISPGEHGAHVHEKGDCSAVDASSAGGHFNPAATVHGRAGSGAHHAGDMDNLVADAQGVARVDIHLQGVTLGGGAANDIAGRALVVHMAPDDYRSQPAGNSGARVACGVITVVR